MFGESVEMLTVFPSNRMRQQFEFGQTMLCLLNPTRPFILPSCLHGEIDND